MAKDIGEQQRCFGIEMPNPSGKTSPEATFPTPGISNSSLYYSMLPTSTSMTRLIDNDGLLSTLINNGTSLLANGSENGAEMEASGAGNGASVNEAARVGSQRDSLDQLRFYTYGVLMPTFCVLGILGNVLNLTVLTRPNMRSVSHIYMRGYALSALLAIACAIPFCVRMAAHEEVGQWTSYPVAFFHTYLELYLGNTLLGNGVMMMIALTLERYAAICHPTRTRDSGINTSHGAKRAQTVVLVVPVICSLIYFPYIFHAMIEDCHGPGGQIIYQRRDNLAVQGAAWYKVYKWFLQCIFRLLPVTVLGWLNVCIIVAYRKVCSKRRRLTRRATCTEKGTNSDARRLMFLLGVTSCLFLVCLTPVAVLSIIFSTEMYLDSLPLQIFRAIANILEIVNFAMTFYIYCLFSTEFRQTFLVMVGLKSSAPSLGGAAASEARSLARTSNRVPQGVLLAPNNVSYPTFSGSQIISTPSRDTIVAHSTATTSAGRAASDPEIGRLSAGYNVTSTSLLSSDINTPMLELKSSAAFLRTASIHSCVCDGSNIDVNITPPTPCNVSREHRALDLRLGNDEVIIS